MFCLPCFNYLIVSFVLSASTYALNELNILVLIYKLYAAQNDSHSEYIYPAHGYIYKAG